MKVWEEINRPIIVVVLCGMLGWAFLKFVWEPHQLLLQDGAKRAEYRKEAYLRIDDIKRHLSSEWLGPGLRRLVEGAYPLNPSLKDWSLRSLISSGWDQSVYDTTIDHIDSLQTISDDGSSPNQIARIRLHLSYILAYLKQNDEK